MIRVALVGGSGRMGQTMLAALSAVDDFSIVALVDPHEPPSKGFAAWVTSLADLSPHDVDVIVDFSNVEVASRSLEWGIANSVAVVVGASGFTNEDIAKWTSEFATHGGHGLIASNFSVGAVLAERFAEQAAPYFASVEIIELHHDRKVDSPSGTSLATAQKIALARERAGQSPIVDPTQRETVPHGRGADAAGGVRVHSVRLPGLVAHQEIIFGHAGEGLTIRHDSYDRLSFVTGVTLAVRGVRERQGLTVGINELV